MAARTAWRDTAWVAAASVVVNVKVRAPFCVHWALPNCMCAAAARGVSSSSGSSNSNNRLHVAYRTTYIYHS